MKQKNSILIQSNVNTGHHGNNVTVVYDKKSFDEYMAQYLDNKVLADCLFPIFVLRSFDGGSSPVASDVFRFIVANSYRIDEKNGNVYAFNTNKRETIQIPRDYRIIHPAGWQIYPSIHTMKLTDAYKFAHKYLQR